MALSKKDAEKVLSSLKLVGLSVPKIKDLLDDLKSQEIKNKSFRKSLKRIKKLLEPKKNKALKTAA